MKKKYMTKLVKTRMPAVKKKKEFSDWMSKEEERVRKIEQKQFAAIKELNIGVLILLLLTVILLVVRVNAEDLPEPTATPEPTTETVPVKVEVSIDETETAKKTAEIGQKLESLEKVQKQTLEIMQTTATTTAEPGYNEKTSIPLPTTPLDITRKIYTYMLELNDDYYIFASNSSELNLIKIQDETTGRYSLYLTGLYKNDAGEYQQIVGFNSNISWDVQDIAKSGSWGYPTYQYRNENEIRIAPQQSVLNDGAGNKPYPNDDGVERKYIVLPNDYSWQNYAEGEANYIGITTLVGNGDGTWTYGASQRPLTIEENEIAYWYPVKDAVIEQEAPEVKDLFIPICIIAGAAVLYILRRH